MSNRDELIFWFDQPPKVSLGAFNYVSAHWGNKVLYIADHGFGEHRKMINWDNSDYGDAELLLLSEQQNEEEFIKEIFEKYPNAIHIMNGLFSTIEKKIRKYVKKTGVKLAVHSEKPFITKQNISFKQAIKNVLLPIKYRISHIKYNKYVKALISLGLNGKECFEKCGWSSEKTYSFMYCAELAELGDDIVEQHDEIRFLYVGRFDENRLAVALKAFDTLKDKNGWNLTLVGGYGKYADTTKAWIDAHERVQYGGLWPSDEVGKRMQDYDVYLLATGMEGWNAQLNEAINAGMGIITTDEAVSDEMVTAANNGIVVKAHSVEEFAKALETAIDNPEMVRKWKQNAYAYRHKIKGNVVGEYLMDILDYTFYDKNEKPKCPWL